METTPQRKNDILASNLLFGSLAFAIITKVVQFFVFHKPEPMFRNPMIWAIGFALALVVGHYYAIRLGKRWAKILFAVFFVISIVSLFIHPGDVLQSMKTDLIHALELVVGWFCHITAMILLFKRARLQVD